MRFAYLVIPFSLLLCEGLFAALPPAPGNYTVSQVAGSSVNATINNSGQVAGSTLSGNSVYLWTPLSANGPVGNLVDLGGFPALGANTNIPGTMNDRGQIVGTTVIQNSTSQTLQVFLWSPGAANGATGNFSTVPITPGIGARINNFGQVAASSQVWTPAVPNGNTGAIFSDSRLNIAGGINSFGQVIIENGSQPMLFTPSSPNGSTGTFTAIPGLPGASNTLLVAINNNGAVLGAGCTPAANGCQQRGFVWTPNVPNGTTGTTVEIPLPAGFIAMNPIGLNASGQVLGELVQVINQPTTPFLYSGGTMYDLSTIAGVPGTTRFLAINDPGQFLFLAGSNVYLISQGPGTPPPPPNAVPVSIASQPAGLAFVVTGANCSAGSYTTPQAVNWTPGANCTVEFISPNSTQAGVRYAFGNWLDGVASNSRTIVAPTQTTTYTASFTTQYPLFPVVSPAGAGMVSGAGWYDANSTANISATPAAGFRLAGWVAAAGITGTNSATVAMIGAQRPAAVFVPVLTAPPASYTVTQIATNSAAAAGKPINNFGQVVGATTVPGFVNGTPLTSAFLWTPAGANGNVGSVTEVGGIPGHSAANSINDRGQVVGKSADQAFLWSPAAPNGTTGGITSLVGVAANGVTSATAINALGEIGGPDNGKGTSFLWVPSAPNSMTGALTDDSRLGFAGLVGINDFGQVVLVGYSYDSSQLFTPSTANGTSGTLTPIVAPGAPFRPVVAINNQATVLGKDFIWMPNAANATTGTSTAIPLPAGIPAIEAAALDSAADVVGSFALDGGVTSPFLYMGGTLYDLGTVSGVPGNARAVGINDHGQIVLNANNSVYLVSPVTPLPNPGPNDVPVTIASSTPGRAFTVSGSGCRPGGYTTPQTLSWTPGSSCTVMFLSPNSTEVGTRFVFSGWGDGPAANPRVIGTPAQAATYTANFGLQYFLTVLLSPAGTGTVTGGGWYNANDRATLIPSPASGFRLLTWLPPTVAATGSALASVPMTGPMTVTADFAAILNAPPVPYTVTQIVSSGSAGGLNNFGQVVGAADSGPRRAFLWTPSAANGATGSLTTVRGVTGVGTDDNVANAINDRGQIAGTTSAPDLTTSAAFLWTPISPNSAIGNAVAIRSGGAGSPASSSFINNFGQVAGYQSGVFLWTPAAANGSTGTANNIGQGTGTGLNDFGEVIFDQIIGGDFIGNVANLFIPATANGSTGVTGTFGGNQTYVRGINSGGAIVGINLGTVPGGFLFIPDTPNGRTGNAAPIPVPPGFTAAVPNTLNSSGQVVGLLYATGTTPTPFLAGNTIYDLSQISGMPLGATPIAINDHGQILVSVYNGGVYLLSPQTVQPPTADAVRPPSGSATGQTMVFEFSDVRGWQDLNVMNILINNALDGRAACYLAYSRPLNVLYLMNDAGTALLTGLTLNGSGSLSNSQCTVNGAGSSAIGSAGTLTLTLNLTFGAGFTGNKVVYLAARDLALDNSGWVALGTWNVPGGSTFPSVGGVSPANGAGPNPTLTFTFGDTKGYQDLGVVNILINDALDGRQACYLAYSQPLKVLYLVNDAGTGLTSGLTLNGMGSISNGQCTVNSAGSSATANGNSLMLVLNVAFTNTFSGHRVIYMASRDLTDANSSGWQAVGTWLAQ